MSAGAQLLEAPLDELDVQSREPLTLKPVVDMHLVIYGDFTCPWSYLASRRAAVLAANGVTVDWRAVEHDPRRPSRTGDGSLRLRCLREEMDRVLALLLPGEELPYALAGFVPYTKAAVSGYAEAYAAGVGAQVQRLLFEAFWMHSFDLDSPEAVRTLLVDDVRSGTADSDLVREWGHAVDLTGGPLTTTAWRLIRQWGAEWHSTGKETVPVLVVDGGAPRFGVDAVEWLGVELARRGAAVDEVPPRHELPARSHHDIASYSWASQHGGRWLRDYQQAHGRPRFN
ncbi:MAG TPA: DsbA family protein [Marmoricola sp.]|nr:DsbA family protein [Marmoricola sp.]